MTTRKHDEDEHKAQKAEEDAKKAAAEKKHTSDTAPAPADPKHGPTKDPMATPTWPVHGPNPVSEQK